MSPLNALLSTLQPCYFFKFQSHGKYGIRNIRRNLLNMYVIWPPQTTQNESDWIYKLRQIFVTLQILLQLLADVQFKICDMLRFSKKVT